MNTHARITIPKAALVQRGLWEQAKSRFGVPDSAQFVTVLAGTTWTLENTFGQSVSPTAASSRLHKNPGDIPLTAQDAPAPEAGCGPHDSGLLTRDALAPPGQPRQQRNNPGSKTNGSRPPLTRT